MSLTEVGKYFKKENANDVYGDGVLKYIIVFFIIAVIILILEIYFMVKTALSNGLLSQIKPMKYKGNGEYYSDNGITTTLNVIDGILLLNSALMVIGGVMMFFI